jgi:hypothetical protein
MRRGLLAFRGVAPLELPAERADGVTYVITKQAAELMGVTPATITRWRSRGYLRPVPGSPSRKPFYAWDDVVEAEHKARMAAIAASGTDAQCRRSIAA